MIYRGSAESQDKPSSQDRRAAQAADRQDQGSRSADVGSPAGLTDRNPVAEDAWLRIFQDEIASSSQATIEATSSPAGAASEPSARRGDGSHPSSQRSDGEDSPAAPGYRWGARKLWKQIARHRRMLRFDFLVARGKTGFIHWRRSFGTLPRHSQRWVVIAGIAGVSAILWGLLAPSSGGTQNVNAAERLAQAQMSNSVLKRQVQHLNGVLATARTEREQLRNEVDALTEERDWLAARLDAVASAGTPVIDGATAPVALATASTSSAEPEAPAGPDYEVAKGDTLWSIARRHDVAVKQLAAANGIGSTDPLQLGQRLIIPGSESPSPANGQTTAKQVATEEAKQTSADPARQVEYTVQRGDSLYAISRQFDVSVEELQAWNRLDKSEVLRPSQRLIVYVHNAADTGALP